MLRQNEFGDTYYIILEGKVAVYLNIDVTKLFTLSDLFIFVVDNYNLLIEDEKKNNLLKELRYKIN